MREAQWSLRKERTILVLFLLPVGTGDSLRETKPRMASLPCHSGLCGRKPIKQAPGWLGKKARWHALGRSSAHSNRTLLWVGAQGTSAPEGSVASVGDKAENTKG